MDANELRELWVRAAGESHPTLDRYRKLAKDLVKSWKSGDAETITIVSERHPRLRKLTEAERRTTRFTLADAQFVIARDLGFESWPKLKKFTEAPASTFESAVEAVISGDVATLERLLRENPELIRERSVRAHRSTLLHYVGANGVEDYRQKTPTNAVAVTKVLLGAGAEVDAAADMYGGGSTTLGLLASSCHPARAGLQPALIETLLDAGAAIDGLPGRWQPIMAAIVHGHSDAVDTLVRRGARLNIASAAAAGRLDVVERMVVNGSEVSGAVEGLPREWKGQVELAFIWACQFGRRSVAELLLDKGVDSGAQDGQGETGLHWAAHYGQVDLVKFLIERKAPLEVKNNYGGTVLGQTTWAAMNDPHENHARIVEMLIDAGAKVDQADYPTGNESVDEVLRRHGAKP
jgi:ankyrin repeat protein